MNNKKYKIAIFSSARPHVDDEVLELSHMIGKYLAENNILVVTGGCLGVPGEVVKSVKENGGVTEAYFPDFDPSSHSIRHDNLDVKYFDLYKFIPGFTERSVKMIEDVDGAIVLNGRMGTLSEFSIAAEEGLPLAVVKGSGGITDQLEHIIEIAEKEYATPIYFNSDYRQAIDSLVSYLDKKNK